MNSSLLQAAVAAEEAGRLEEALGLYGELLAADPACVEALNNLGALAFRIGQAEEALNFYQQALALRPDFLASRINMARALARLGRIDEADQNYLQAIAQGATIEGERAQMYLQAGQPATAQSVAQDACLQRPEDAELWLILGNARLYQHSPEEAELCYRRAISLADTARAQANLALALLAQARYDEAWPLYENRYDPSLRAHDSVRFAPPACPQWQGEPMAGKRILVIGEQGFGDQIHFVRFIEPLAAQRVQVELLCHPSLVPVLGSAPGVSACHGSLPAAARYDYWTPLLSLPGQLGGLDGTRYWHMPYLSAPMGKRPLWHQHLFEWGASKTKIGVVWAGAAGNAVDTLRSLPLDAVLALFAGLGERYLVLSLQTGEQAMNELERQCLAGIIPVGDMLMDFGDTAALIAELDLVIAVDTAVAHLAGALDKPAWLLLPGTDWRWGRAGADTCALYPSVKPFWRDPVKGWDGALQALRLELEKR